MKYFSTICLLLFAMVVPVFGAPTTQPLPDVLIVPFKPLAEPNAQPALGRAIQVNLLADLGHARFHPVQENDLNADAQTAGRNAGARYVISGTWQSAGDLLRFTGEITDVQTGLIVGGLSATGSPRDLFAVEDALSAQAIRQLHQLTTPSPTTPPVAAELPLPVPAPVRPYPGSALEAYVNSNRTPSEDYWDQSRSAHDIQTYGFNQPAYSPYYGGYGYYGYGVPYYGGFSYGYGLVGAVSFPGRHLPFR
jgi:TolB-like protein